MQFLRGILELWWYGAVTVATAAVHRLDEAGIGSIGLGLGSEAGGLARLFPRSVTGIPPARLVDHLGALLESTLAVLPGVR